jgi:hypothetical protein
LRLEEIDQGAVKDAAGYYIQVSETGSKPPVAGGARARKRSEPVDKGFRRMNRA